MVHRGLIGVWLILLGGSLFTVLAQQGKSLSESRNEVIEIEARILDVRSEQPQAQIFDKRKKVDLEEVKVEKNFKTELSLKSEDAVVLTGKMREIGQIENIKALLEKKRF